MRNLAAALASCVLCALLSLVLATAVARAELKPINPFAATEVAPAPPSAFAPRPVAVPFQSTGPLGRLFAWVLGQAAGLATHAGDQRQGSQDRQSHGRRRHPRRALLPLRYLARGGPRARQDHHLVLRRRQRGDGQTRGDHFLHRRWLTGADRGRPRRLASVRAQRIRTSGQCLVEPARERELRDDRARRPLPADDPAAAVIPELARHARSACRRRTACACSCRASSPRSCPSRPYTRPCA